MEEVLDLYEEPYDEKRLVVCFDESPEQLIEEVRQPLPVPSQPVRYDIAARLGTAVGSISPRSSSRCCPACA